jgi:hypothetical protein
MRGEWDHRMPTNTDLSDSSSSSSDDDDDSAIEDQDDSVQEHGQGSTAPYKNSTKKADFKRMKKKVLHSDDPPPPLAPLETFYTKSIFHCPLENCPPSTLPMSNPYNVLAHLENDHSIIIAR